MVLRVFCLGAARADFELAALRRRLVARGLGALHVEAQYFCVAELREPPPPGFAALLGATAEALPDWPAAERCLVVPRRGVVSAWADKAQAILGRAGLGAGCERLERGVAWRITPAPHWEALRELICDRMVEELLDDPTQLADLLRAQGALPLEHIDVLGSGGLRRLQVAAARLGLSLALEELRHLRQIFGALGRKPTDVELMSYAQINSEHCRHKVFNAPWAAAVASRSEPPPAPYSLMDLIRRTSHGVAGIHSAYRDNAAVFAELPAAEFAPEGAVAGEGYRYRRRAGPLHLVAKVETHNHPTAISPFPGAGTGIGGEIRDEAAVGRGARSLAGLCGFSVSHLRLPELPQLWEGEPLPAPALASPLDIMLQAPLGAAAFANEFGRPTLCGYFRSFEQPRRSRPQERQESRHGYHKPIMLAGGLGVVRPEHVHSQLDKMRDGDCLVVLGGPALRIGLGGGSSSSRVAGAAGDEALDFASVQRQNPEMQRRCQELIDRCRRLGDGNPIALIHDVGAGGLSNALPELVWELSADEPVRRLLADGASVGQLLGEGLFQEEEWAARFGAQIDLRAIPSADPSLSPLELWCNEAQERFVLVLRHKSLDAFGALCAREDCPWAVVGTLRHRRRAPQLAKGGFRVVDGAAPTPLDLPLPYLFLPPPGRRAPLCAPTVVARRQLEFFPRPRAPRQLADIELAGAVRRVLQFPAVAAKNFLITIGDRTVGGLTCRDQLVGPWQVPVADAAVLALDYDGCCGGALALGERTPLAVRSPAAAARMALGEALTNLAAVPLAAAEPREALCAAVLSANWMSADTKGDQGHPALCDLHEAVQALSALCVDLGIAVPVGKDSLSMEVRWTAPSGTRHRVAAPLSPVVSAFAPVADVRAALTPQLRSAPGSALLLLDLGAGRARLGGSCLAQVFGRDLGEVPDLDSAAHFHAFFAAVQDCLAEGLLLAYHDRSDGGLFACLCEMAFAGRLGFDVELPPGDEIAQLFNEELGAVLQCRDEAAVRASCRRHGLPDSCLHRLGQVTGPGAPLRFLSGGEELLRGDRAEWQSLWQETSHHMQTLRDNPDCAREEFEAIGDEGDGGLSAHLTFDPAAAPSVNTGARPRLAVLRDRGSNGHYEMAAAFDRAGFDCLDVHTTDLVAGSQTLADCHGLAACGGFSCGDVLGAGRGWAAALAGDARSRDALAAFLTRPDSFALGICNGCQLLADPLWRQWIPGSEDWPRFVTNRSQRFESRWVMVEIPPSPSLLLGDMAGSRLPVPVAHAEGRADFAAAADGALARLEATGAVALRYVDHRGRVAERYPANPAGAPAGLAGLCSSDGRVTIMMPHPERAFRTAQHSYAPEDWGESAPWLQLFRNARHWLG